MKLTLKRKSTYAVRASILIARNGDQDLINARAISERLDVSYKFLTQILANLVSKKILRAKHGPTGGYQLALPASDITLLDIIEAAEGPVDLGYCALHDVMCDLHRPCVIHETWVQAQTTLSHELGSASLADLVEQKQQGRHL